MDVTVFAGDIVEAPADAICTSTNPRLTLMMGTGGAVRERGGFAVLRACEEIVARHEAATGRGELPVGSVHITAAGALPYKGVIHCVVSGGTHTSSPDIIRTVVVRALGVADEFGFASVAMPVFGTGHAHVKFDRALVAMAEALRSATTSVSRVVVVVRDAERAETAKRAFA